MILAALSRIISPQMTTASYGNTEESAKDSKNFGMIIDFSE